MITKEEREAQQERLRRRCKTRVIGVLENGEFVEWKKTPGVSTETTITLLREDPATAALGIVGFLNETELGR